MFHMGNVLLPCTSINRNNFYFFFVSLLGDIPSLYLPSHACTPMLTTQAPSLPTTIGIKCTNAETTNVRGLIGWAQWTVSGEAITQARYSYYLSN